MAKRDVITNLMHDRVKNSEKVITWNYDPTSELHLRMRGLFRFALGLGESINDKDFNEFLKGSFAETLIDGEYSKELPVRELFTVPEREGYRQRTTESYVSRLQVGKIDLTLSGVTQEFICKMGSGHVTKYLIPYDKYLGARELASYNLRELQGVNPDYRKLFYGFVAYSPDFFRAWYMLYPLFLEAVAEVDEIYEEDLRNDTMPSPYYKWDVAWERMGRTFNERRVLEHILQSRFKPKGNGVPYMNKYYVLIQEKMIDLALVDYYRYVGLVEEDRQQQAYRDMYATSFMTKKHITKEKQEWMVTSPFLDRFSYVEYDNDIELDKLKVVYDQYVANISPNLPTNPKLFENSDIAGEHTLRFRKLGNHNALGLYFPGVGCMAVDMRATRSFVHEYGHKFDFLCGIVDNTPEMVERIVVPYRKAYKELLANMKANGSIMYPWYSAKEDYYCGIHEIFARGFELYVYEKRLNCLDTGLVHDFAGTVNDLNTDERYQLEGTVPYTSLEDVKDDLYILIENHWA